MGGLLAWTSMFGRELGHRCRLSSARLGVCRLLGAPEARGGPTTHASLEFDLGFLKTSQEQTQLPRATTPGPHWKTRKSFSRSTLGGQKGFSETALKSGMVSESAGSDRRGGCAEGASAVWRRVSRRRPPRPCVACTSWRVWRPPPRRACLEPASVISDPALTLCQ